MPEKTAEAWRNGWFHTGDGVVRDERGRYHFVDRIKDSMRRRGENISSMEVEAYVNEHPAVSETAAIGVPSEHGEDEVKVCVVLHERPVRSPTPSCTSSWRRGCPASCCRATSSSSRPRSGPKP